MGQRFRSERAIELHEQLYHISFRDNLEGVWDVNFNQKPDENHPEDGKEQGEPWPYPEPNLPRISCATTIEGCFRGVFPNVNKFFEEKKFPHMNFFVYSPDFKGSEKIITNEMLIKDRLVWDAHETGEVLILDNVFMKRVGEVEVYNTNKSPTLYTHPFGDRKLGKESVGPRDIKFKWI